jgi:hypothetical protein
MKSLLKAAVVGALLAGAAIVGIASCGKATASITNKTGAPVTVYVAFGADSVVTSFPFCTPTGRLNCTFPIASSGEQILPMGITGRYLNATFSVNGPVTCGVTKFELNLNNPSWFDIVDISLVDGFSTKIGISVKDSAGTHQLGPVVTQGGNEKVFGVYPYGCDICIARSSPPCGIPKGHEGCKTGPDQYHPDVPCQYQGTRKGGGSAVRVTLE